MSEKHYRSISEAARASDLAAVQAFIAANPNAVHETNTVGFTPLHQAIVADNCGNVNFELVRLLVEAGSPINALSKDGRSPLWLAGEFCPSVEIVQYLIDNGADLNTLATREGCDHLVDCIDTLDEQKEVQLLLSQLSGHPLPAPPPPPKYPDQRADTAVWRKATAAVKKAFAALEKAGIVTLPNAGYTVGEGIAECFDRWDTLPDKARFSGYCFYTEPSKGRAREFGILDLNYGMLGDDDSGMSDLANQIVSLLQQQGFDTEWDGNTQHCITIWLQPLYAQLKAA